MDTTSLRGFLAAVEAGTITGAARKLHLSQPTLSRRIKSLEEELGVDLFQRGAHSVTLTPAGRVLAEDGPKWLQMGDLLRQKALTAALGRLLRVGYAPSLAGHFLGLALERFNQIHTNVRVKLSDLSTKEMLDRLMDGRLDLVVTIRDTRRVGLRWEPLEQRPWRLVVAVGHPLAKRREVRVSELVTEPLLMFSRDDYPEYWEAVGRYLMEHGVAPRIAGEFDGFSSLAMAVEARIGVALVAEAAGERRGLGLHFLKLSPSPEPICVAAGWAEEDEAALILIEELKKVRAL